MALRNLASRVAAGVRCHYRQSLVVTTPPANPSRLVFPLFLRRFATVKEEDCKFLKSHEYIFLNDDVGIVGISDFAQKALGDIVYVELPDVGAKVEKGKPFGVVESVKSANDVYSPVTGEVVSINKDLGSEPAKVNKKPYDDGWMLKVKVEKKSELGELLNFEQYEKHCEEDSH